MGGKHDHRRSPAVLGILHFSGKVQQTLSSVEIMTYVAAERNPAGGNR